MNLLLTDLAGQGWRVYEQMDLSRRLQGDLMQAAGFGAEPAPSRVVLELPEVTLREYEGGGLSGGPALVLVPAPIKRSYIFDLAPGASVARFCLEAGLRVFLVQWEAPQPGRPGPGIADYADRLLLECLDAVARETGGGSVFVAAHSLGGTLAAIFAALHPGRVQGLVLLASPLHFDFAPEAGALGPAIAAVDRSGMLESVPGHVPGSFLSVMSFASSPASFGRDRWDDWIASLPDPEAMRTHLRVERWSLDELPLSHRFVQDLVGRLFREDAFMRGTLEAGEGCAAPAAVKAPLLLVADERCRIVPPAALLPFYEAVAGSKALLWYPGDTGVAIQHVGMLVGRNALASLWPEILGWVRRQARGNAHA
jgi:polyhydroxyalkanoate synthase